MQLIIGTILFWIVILGYMKILDKKYGIEKLFLLPITFSSLGIIVFIAGILNMIPLVTILLILIGIILFGYYTYKEKPTIKDLKENIKKPSVFIPIIIFTYITLVGMNMHLTHYDNFSHWGLIIKNMFLEGSLPNFEDTVIFFKGYQPGSACFTYFYGFLTGKQEASMIVAQNYLTFAFLIPLFNFIKSNTKVLKNILITIFYIFIMTVSIRFNDLLVDAMVSTMAISSLAILTHYKKDIKKGFLYSLPISIFVFLVKNTGFLIVAFNCIYLLYLAKQNKKLKKGLKYAAITLLTVTAFLLIWQSHVKLVFGDMSLYSKHSLSTDNVILSLRTKGWDKLLLLTKNYILHLFTLKDNISNVYILIINALLFMFYFFEKDKKEKKNVLLLTITVDILYLVYWGVIGVMYLTSMPFSEAIDFSGYERYMTAAIIIIIGIVFFYILGYKNNNKNIKFITISSILLMLSTIFILPGSFKSLIGNDSYKGSKVNRYDIILKDYKDFEKNKSYYVYESFPKKDYNFLSYLSKYKLNSNNVKVIREKEDLREVQKGTIIFFEEDKELIKEFKDNDWKELSKQILEK